MGSCVLKVSAVECRSTSLIECSSRLTLDRQSINISIGRVESRLMYYRFILVGLHSANYRETVNQMSIGCRPSTAWNVVNVSNEMLIQAIDRGYDQYSTADALNISMTGSDFK